MSTKRFFTSFFVLTVLFAMIGLAIGPASAAITAEWANLDQWDRIAGDWQNGNLGADIYSEGRVVPFRAALEGFAEATVYNITISHELTKGGSMGYDFLARYDMTETDVDETALCSTTGGADSTLCDLPLGLLDPGVVNPALATAFTYSAVSPTFATPPHLAGVNILGAVNQNVTTANAYLTTWGAQAVSVGATTYSGSTSGDADASVVIQLTTPATCPGDECAMLLAWGGHLASSSYWRLSVDGGPNGAGAISGSAYHMRTTGYGNQDKSIKTGADLLTFVEVIKDLNSLNYPNGTFDLFIQEDAETAVQGDGTCVGDGGTTSSLVFDINELTPFTVYELSLHRHRPGAGIGNWSTATTGLAAQRSQSPKLPTTSTSPA